MQRVQAVGFRAFAAALLFALVAIMMAFPVGGSGKPARGSSAQLDLDPLAGSVLPTRNGVSALYLECQGKRGETCEGKVRLEAGDGQTGALVGTDPIARRRLEVKAGREKSVRLELSDQADSALDADAELLVDVVLRSDDGSRRFDDFVVAEFAPFEGHAEPDEIQDVQASRGEGNGPAARPDETEYTWDWDIPAAHYLLLPEFRCPGSDKVANNGFYLQEKRGNRFYDYGIQADLAALASKKSIGYAGFNVPHTEATKGSDSYPEYKVMIGWPKGTWAYNSVWTGLDEGGNFRLTVTCTSSTARRNVAWLDSDRSDSLLFPRRYTSG